MIRTTYTLLAWVAQTVRGNPTRDTSAGSTPAPGTTDFECACGLTDCPDRSYHNALVASVAPEWTV